MARLGCLLALLGAFLAIAPAAWAADLAGTRSELGRAMQAAGSRSGAYVVDLETGGQLYASRAGTGRIPASVEKLYTTATLLRRLGPRGRLATQALATGAVDEEGTLQGNLYLRGAGDPTFGAASATALARQIVAQTGLARIDGRVIGDETAFDRRRGPPSSGYRTSGYVGPLSALAYGRGLTGVRSPYFQVSPGLFATQAFERALRAEDVRIGSRARTGRTPASAALVAALESPAVEELIARTNRPSDNYFAETLIKVVGSLDGGPGTTATGARRVRAAMRELRLSPRVVDGSGLSRSNRTSPRQVVGLLGAMAADPVAAAPFEASLAVAGRTGTLTGRMRGTAAAGNCRAKTGTLSDVSALAGYCTAADGERRIAFAILMNGVNTFGARQLQDRMAATLARYDP